MIAQGVWMWKKVINRQITSNSFMIMERFRLQFIFTDTDKSYEIRTKWWRWIRTLLCCDLILSTLFLQNSTGKEEIYTASWWGISKVDPLHRGEIQTNVKHKSDTRWHRIHKNRTNNTQEQWNKESKSLGLWNRATDWEFRVDLDQRLVIRDRNTITTRKKLIKSNYVMIADIKDGQCGAFLWK